MAFSLVTASNTSLVLSAVGDSSTGPVLLASLGTHIRSLVVLYRSLRQYIYNIGIFDIYTNAVFIGIDCESSFIRHADKNFISRELI